MPIRSRTACAAASASRLRHACAACQPALQPAQQDPRHLVAGRGLPVRRADAPRCEHQALAGVRGRGRPLHGLPQVRVALPGQDRLRRRDHEHAQPVAQDGPKSFRPGNAAAMFMLNATNPETIKLARTAMVGVGFKAQRLAVDLFKTLGRKQTSAPPGHGGHRARQRAGHPLRQQEAAWRPAQKTARALLDIEDKDYVPIIRRRKWRPMPRPSSTSPAAARSASSARSASPPRPCFGMPACRRCCPRLPVLRLPAASARPVRQGREDDHRQPGALPPRRQHAQLPRHQDRRRQLRHLF